MSNWFSSQQFQHLSMLVMFRIQQRGSQEREGKLIEAGEVRILLRISLEYLHVVIREVWPKGARLNHEQRLQAQQLLSGQQVSFSSRWNDVIMDVKQRTAPSHPGQLG